MTVEMHPVYSSHITALGHDAGAGELHVQWDSGRTSVFGPGIDAATADRIRKSRSVGQAVTKDVKGKFGHRYLE